MDIQLQELIDKIKKEGISKAEEDAKATIDAAEKKKQNKLLQMLMQKQKKSLKMLKQKFNVLKRLVKKQLFKPEEICCCLLKMELLMN